MKSNPNTPPFRDSKGRFVGEITINTPTPEGYYKVATTTGYEFAKLPATLEKPDQKLLYGLRDDKLKEREFFRSTGFTIGFDHVHQKVEIFKAPANDYLVNCWMIRPVNLFRMADAVKPGIDGPHPWRIRLGRWLLGYRDAT